MDLFSSAPESVYPFLSSLSEEQKNAAVHMGSPSLVLAGAGSGKTHTLCAKVKYFIEKGIPAQAICAVTFSAKAAEELQNRLAEKHKIYNVEARTFHSLGNKILRQSVEYSPYKRGFKLIKDWEVKSCLIQYLNNVFAKGFDWSLLKYYISMAKKNLVQPKDYEEFLADKGLMNMDIFVPSYQAYEDYKRINNLIDFDDMIYVPNIMLEEIPAVRNRYENSYEYCLVDEAQDNNLSQFNLIKILGNEKNITVIGDDFQSIYGFQGARPDITIYGFHRSSNAEVFLLNDNYRSNPEIVRAANLLAANMDNSFGKQMNPISKNSGGVKVNCYFGQHEEAEEIASEIYYDQQETERSWDDYAIIYRVNSQSRAVEEALMYREIPYIVLGGVSFFDRKETKDIMAYFRLSVDPEKYHNDVRRVANIASAKYFQRTRKIGSAFISDLLKVNENIWKALYKTSGDARAVDLINFVSEIKKQPTPGAKIAYIIDNCYSRYIREDEGSFDEDSGEDKAAIVEEIRQAFSMFKKDEELIAHVYKMQNKLKKDEDEMKNRVKVMTIHKSKGLEWPNVYLISANDGILPHARAEGPDGYAEERRIMYVAVTRAACRLSISFLSIHKNKPGVPSPFLKEMNLSVDGAIADAITKQKEIVKLADGQSLLAGD